MLFRRRELWWPTGLGWAALLLALVAPVALWWFFAESLLSRSAPVPTDILVLEGWIGTEGIAIAAKEFHTGGYRHVVVTGGWTGEAWTERRWSHVTIAEPVLRQAEAIVLTETVEADHHRTHAAAIAARNAIRGLPYPPRGISVFTRSVHACRSRMIFSRWLGQLAPVGVVAWKPPGSEERDWWNHSYRAEDLLEETVGVLYELIVRPSIAPQPAGRTDNVHTASTDQP